jgi:predicted transcriptional regulator
MINKNDNRVTIVIKKEQLDKLKNLADSDGRSVSFLARKAIEQFIDNELTIGFK